MRMKKKLFDGGFLGPMYDLSCEFTTVVNLGHRSITLNQILNGLMTSEPLGIQQYKLMGSDLYRYYPHGITKRSYLYYKTIPNTQYTYTAHRVIDET